MGDGGKTTFPMLECVRDLVQICRKCHISLDLCQFKLILFTVLPGCVRTQFLTSFPNLALMDFIFGGRNRKLKSILELSLFSKYKIAFVLSLKSKVHFVMACFDKY